MANVNALLSNFLDPSLTMFSVEHSTGQVAKCLSASSRNAHGVKVSGVEERVPSIKELKAPCFNTSSTDPSMSLTNNAYL